MRVKSKDDFISVIVEEKWIEMAKERRMNDGVFKNSFMNGERTIYGYIAEHAFESIYSPYITLVNEINNDFIFNGFKVDVKTITSKVCPELHFKASIAKTSNQQCDIIVFSRILPDMSLIRFVGWLTKSEFDYVKKLFQKGTEDKSNNLVAKADTWDCYIHQLSAMKYLEPHILTS